MHSTQAMKRCIETDADAAGALMYTCVSSAYECSTSCNEIFRRKAAPNFRPGKIRVLQNLILPSNSPKIRDFQQNYYFSNR